VAGSFYSPIDAVRRRLAGSEAPSIRQLVELVITGFSSSTDQAVVRADNLAAWQRKVDDRRFVGSDVPPDRAAAHDALDPWLQRWGIEGSDLLCLGAGGATHSPLFAMAGARVTVVDFSPAQLQLDRQAAERYRLEISTVLASIDDLSPLGDASFDWIVQPVSSCYVRDVLPVYAEAARVLRAGGRYLVQHKQPGSLQAGNRLAPDAYPVLHPSVEGWHLPPAGDVAGTHREADTHEFVHTLETLLGGLCRAGFSIEDVQEPPRGDAWAPAGSAEHRAGYLPPYLKLMARRVSVRDTSPGVE
jgi:SAM-dependent methyltransferase